jgi:DNA topoisomerase I
MRFKFRGKSGKIHTASLSDRRLARIVQRCQALPGEDLFQYLDADGVEQTVGSGDVNDYLREITGEDFTAKDFRTWTGTTLALAALEEIGPSPDEREAKSAIVRAIDRVAEQLNNTRAVCRKYYVHPMVFEHYLAGTATNGKRSRPTRKPAPPTSLTPDERAVIRLLNAQAKVGRRQPP